MDRGDQKKVRDQKEGGVKSKGGGKPKRMRQQAANIP